MKMTGRDESDDDDDGSNLGEEFGFGMIDMDLAELGNVCWNNDRLCETEPRSFCSFKL
jgi:hypothetical protein